MNNAKRIIVIAGPSCVGKTTLLSTLEAEEFAWFREMLDLGAKDTRETRHAWEWQLPKKPVIHKDTLLVHYDLFRITSLNLSRYAQDPILNLLLLANKVTVVTLWESPDILIDRARKRNAQIWWEFFKSRNLARFWQRLGRRRKMRQFYLSPSDLWSLYEQWFIFCRDHGIDAHWAARLTCSGSARLLVDGKPGRPFWEDDIPLVEQGY